MKRHFVNSVSFDQGAILDWDEYPFTVPAIRELRTLELHPNVTFFVG
jgi:predicted ATPase